MDQAKPSICFVCQNGFGAVVGSRNGHIGGAERYLAVMARWFAARAYRVSMVTWDEGQRDGDSTGGVCMVKMCRQNAGLRGLRFVYPRWTSLVRALARADARIYVYNAGDLGLGQVALWCRRNRRRCVYWVMTDPACDPRLPLLGSVRERTLYRIGLRLANRVITQTQRQKGMLREGFGLDSSVLPVPREDVGGNVGVSGANEDSRTCRVLWVGRISEEKRLEWLLDVAQRRPELIFDVVGSANVASRYAAAVLDRATTIPNVIVHGRIPHDEMPEYYRRALCLCCTSVFEGFPNTFLEAWRAGLPVVSTFDPDGLIAERGLGWVAQNVEGLAAHLARLSGSAELRWSVGATARSYFLEKHELEVSMPQFERAFLDMW
jgi:glycosyltransferase involved in cell wall biosynthesis